MRTRTSSAEGFARLLMAVAGAAILALLASPTAPALGASATTAPVQAVQEAPRGAHARARAKTSLPAIERRVMCVTCKIPLMVADSEQASREREYIKGLISEGKTEAQVESALVGQYGPAVLALPKASGFDLAAYMVPLAAVIGLAGVLMLLLPRWRTRARVQAGKQTDTPTLGAADAARLDADLARFER
ncbi:MAG TPA: cytochrome c-type biogenesis protein CcmH [Solirubrobacteraceae bacterium]|nr:cytochrome c-type biogenesis protein CcmH [Solirubrobacteraceae bacterium]